MDERLAEIRKRHAAATPGPWRWFGNTQTRQLYLATPDRGRLFVIGTHGASSRGGEALQFATWEGEQRGRRGGILRTGLELAGETDHNHEFREIDAPDARAIAHSWQDVDDLLGLVDELAGALRPVVKDCANEGGVPCEKCFVREGCPKANALAKHAALLLPTPTPTEPAQ